MIPLDYENLRLAIRQAIMAWAESPEFEIHVGTKRDYASASEMMIKKEAAELVSELLHIRDVVMPIVEMLAPKAGLKFHVGYLCIEKREIFVQILITEGFEFVGRDLTTERTSRKYTSAEVVIAKPFRFFHLNAATPEQLIEVAANLLEVFQLRNNLV